MALSLSTPWHYFADPDTESQADARTRLRALMGTSYASSPVDSTLDDALERAVRFFEAATGRFFVKLTGTVKLHGNGEPRLDLPHPVISSDQGGTGISSITFDTDDTAQDADLFTVNEGADHGPADPRRYPFVEFTPASSTTSVSPEGYGSGLFPYGVQNIALVGTWGYVEADGSTPVLVRKAVAALTIRELAALDDCDDQEDLRRGALTSRSTAGRSSSLHENAVGRGVTTNREIDLAIRRYRRPPRATVNRPPRRARRRGRSWRTP